jgi:hypothetical protein
MTTKGTRGVLQSSEPAIVVLLVSSEVLEILDPPVSETRLSGSAEFGLAKQILTL